MEKDKLFDEQILDCNKIRMMQQAGKKEKIAYIHFSVLRTNILLKKHEIRIDAFDENWYMDPIECSYSYPVNEIYTYLEKYSNVVEELWKQSTDLNDFSDVYRKVFLESNIYLFYVAEIIRQGMRKLIETEEYKSVAKAECFVVCIGGYMDKFDILYKEDLVKYNINPSRDLITEEEYKDNYGIYGIVNKINVTN